MKTNKDLKIKKGSYSAIADSYVFIPKGSEVEKRIVKSGTEGKQTVYFVRPSAIKDALDRHDATYYGIRVNETDVEI